MDFVSRRTVLRGAVGSVAAGALARPYIANAAAKTMTLWWQQGYVHPEDVVIKKIVGEFEKMTGDKINLSIVPGVPLRQKLIAAITSGVVPDAVWSTTPGLIPLQAWQGHLEDVTDVVETQKSHYNEAALKSAYNYNNVKKDHAYYGVPFDQAAVPFHIWGSLIEEAGYKRSDIPNTWTKFIDFFKPLQEPLRKKGMRHTYSWGLEISTNGNDPVNRVRQWLIAYGGLDIVTPDGKLHTSDPKIQEAFIKSLENSTGLFKDGYVPPSTVNWEDADDNNAFHSKLCIVDFDGTLSTEMAMVKDHKRYWEESITHGIPNDDNGKPIPNVVYPQMIIIPTGAKNPTVAKEFAKYFITPKVNVDFVKGGLGRWMPVFPAQVKNDPWWTDPKVDPHRPVYVAMGYDSPTVPSWEVYNPAWAEVDSKHFLNIAFHDVIANGMTPKQAALKAFKEVEKTFEKYPIAKG